ncbi:hypothetical protein EC973_002239 [Apophysomyces ossiformis]|uniref:Uncharacterized protein n=1 Tax=Apophysomyces ossiformis TaxID=679940 RepID=A0A8H7BXS1_9FUNG|nr:hypothetical protein EC973_002239 [Apophysomyces ossiformis]
MTLLPFSAICDRILTACKYYNSTKVTKMDKRDLSDGYASDSSDMEIANSDEELNDIYTSGEQKTQQSPPVQINNFSSDKPLIENHPVSYVIHLGEDSSSDGELIEELYGPFDSYQSPVPDATFTPSPRPTPTPTHHLASREKEIELLKKLIAQKEEERKKLQLRQLPSPSPQPSATSKSSNTVTVNQTSVKDSSLMAELPEVKEKAKVIEPVSMDNSEVELRRSLNAMIEELDHEKAAKAVSDDLSVTLTDTDIGDAFDTSAVDHLSNNPVLVDTTIAVPDCPIGVDDNGYSSDDSFVTASSSVSSDEMEDLQTNDESREVQLQIQELERQIADYNDQLEDIKKSRHAIEVKVLGLQVRISIEKNRKAHTNKPTHTTKESSGIVFGAKRPQPSDDALLSPASKRRREPQMTESTDELEEGQLQPEIRQPETHFNRETSKMALPVPSQEPKALSRQPKSFQDSLTASQPSAVSLSQPFLPPTSVPQHRTPPSPTPLPRQPLPPATSQITIPQTSTASPASPAPSLSRYQQYPAIHPTSKPPFHHTAPKIHRPLISPPSLSPAISTRELPATSNVTPIVDGMKLSTYLIDLEELIKMRLGSDQKTSLVTPSHRSPPRPARVITVDGFTLTLDSVLLERVAAESVQQASIRKVTDKCQSLKQGTNFGHARSEH